ncbi:MAG: O-methyltransferase [Alphaproteobacteria bacterium]|nr:O-methyltransferase [Alphaproteobacteria bacterium]
MIFSKEFTQYTQQFPTQEPSCLQELRAIINKHAKHNISVSPPVGAFLSMLLKMTQKRSVFEMGTFYGYSSLWMALAHPNTHVVTCDIENGENINVARKAWQTAGVSDRIEFHASNGLELLTTYTQPTFDMAFIDANKKSSLPAVKTLVQTSLKPNGFIVVDNFFMRGRVLQKDSDLGNTVHFFNTWLTQQKHLHSSVIPIGDGLSLIMRSEAYCSKKQGSNPSKIKSEVARIWAAPFKTL